MASLKHNTENTDKDQTLNMQDCCSVSCPGVGRGRPIVGPLQPSVHTSTGPFSSQWLELGNNERVCGGARPAAGAR